MAEVSEKNPSSQMDTPTPFGAAEVGMKFDSFEEVEQFIQDYEDNNFVKYYKNDSRTIRAARKRLPRRRMEEQLKYHSITFCCVHHGNFKSTSQGTRPKQTTMRMGCPSKIRFTVSLDGKQLVIVELVTEHSHPIDEESFRALPQKRRLSIKEREEACHILEKKGKRSAQKHLRMMGKDVKMRDLHNLVASSRQQTLYYTNIQAILDHLSQTEEQSSIVEVVTKVDGKIVGIFFQDQEMKRVFASYPQYVIVDATCKSSSLKMPLYAMLVEDGNGQCEIVAVFIVLTSNLDSIQSMILRFKEHNPSWSHIQVIMADKDFTERRVLEEEFPDASVQVCLYHALRAFRQEISKERIGLQKKEISHCMRLMQKLATSKSEAVYLEHYNQLLNTKLKRVIEYFNIFWHSNQEEWVEGMKPRSIALKDEAPKQLEFVDKLLRDVIKEDISVAEVMGRVMKAILSLREARDAAAVMVVKAQSETSDSVVSQFERYVTPFALKYILRQLKLSWQVIVKSNTSTTSCSVKTSGGILDVHLNSCPCRFFQSLYLPCRHIFAVSRYKNKTLFNKDVINSRWTGAYYISSSRLTPSDNDTTTPYGLFSRHERQTRLSEVTQQLVEVVTDGPIEKFTNHLEAIKELLFVLQKGASAKVIEDNSPSEKGEARSPEAHQKIQVKLTEVTYNHGRVTTRALSKEEMANVLKSTNKDLSQDSTIASTDIDSSQVETADLMESTNLDESTELTETVVWPEPADGRCEGEEVTCNNVKEEEIASTEESVSQLLESITT